MSYTKKVLLLVLSILTLSACASTESAERVNPLMKINIPDELVEAPNLPEDDGIPLNAEERKAMLSLGQLDTGLSTEELRQVQLHFKFYAHKHRKSFQLYLDRSGPYLTYIKKVLADRGIPTEIAYLAFVESGFNPNAVSPAGATGMWQFMPFTGKKYGLAQDSWIDERRDPFKAVESAADYLSKLYGDFGDWLFAIAAYNAGEGKIGKAIECTGAGDFFELCRLNNTIPEEKTRLKPETQQYVPRFLAVCKMMRNLDILGFTAPDYDEISLKEIPVPPGSDLRTLAAKAGWNWQEFTAMNPAFRRNVSPPFADSRAYVPSGSAETVVAWLASPEARIYAGWKDYKVRKGDSVASVAKRYGMPADALRVANSLDSDRLRVGSLLRVPGSTKAVAERNERQVASSSLSEITGGKAGVSAVGSYKVKPGDTLHALAKEWNTTPETISSLNGIKGRRGLMAGQTIKIPGRKGAVVAVAAAPAQDAENTVTKKTAGAQTPAAGSPVSSSTGSSGKSVAAADTDKATPYVAVPPVPSSARSYPVKSTHQVKKGETLAGIARNYDVNVADLRTANGLGRDVTRLNAGQKLIIPDSKAAQTQIAAKSAAAPVSSSTVKGGSHLVVQAGDTLYSLARQNNVSLDALCKLNGLSDKSRIKPGQRLVLP